MKSEGLKYFSNVDLQLLALVLFVFIFVAMLFFVFQSRRKPVYGYIESLPLQDLEKGEAHERLS